MSVGVTVVDYGMGNLFSVTQAIERCGATVTLTESVEGISRARALVLPGVGAFGDGMKALRDRGFVEPLRAYARAGRPFLGICLGMQMLLETGEEFGVHEGLGLVPGKVAPIPQGRGEQAARGRKVPHIGWGKLEPKGQGPWTGSILEGLKPGDFTYFVHSYMAVPRDESAWLAACDYDGLQVCAAIRQGSVSGCQFHPEKSGEVGLSILRNFIKGIPV